MSIKGKPATRAKKIAPAQSATDHFFGSTCFNWAVGQTREEVIESLARSAGANIIAGNLKANGGLYCWTCRVLLPQSANYDINNYAPSRIVNADKTLGGEVPIADARHQRILNVKGKATEPFTPA